MTARPKARYAVVSGLLAIAMAFFGCALGSPSSSTSTTPTVHGGGSGSTPTPGGIESGGPGASTPTPSSGGGGGSPAPTAVPAPPHALAWYQTDSSHVAQIWASINGGTPQQITHVPSDGGACLDQIAWSPPVFSPDLTHIVAALGSFGCGDGGLSGNLSVITVSSGTVTPVPAVSSTNGTTIRLTGREAGFIDNNTIWWVNSQYVNEYTIGGSSVSKGQPNGGSGFISDAVVRGDWLYYALGQGSSTSTSFSLLKYQLSTQSGPDYALSLGTYTHCQCPPGDVPSPGFDVSRDGTHVVYQQVTPSGSTTDTGIASSKFYYTITANFSGPFNQVASCVTANTFAFLQMSPNGQLFSLSNAGTSPNVATASVNTPGHCSGDSNLKFYHPDGHSYAVWKWDSNVIWSASMTNGEASPSPGNLEHYDIGAASGFVGVAGGYNPWYSLS